MVINKIVKNKLLLNTVLSLSNQLITIICGFILPRYMLLYYGSEVNGLVSSVGQFLGVIAFMQLGVGAVVQSALYKPLAENDLKSISSVYKSSDRFFKLISRIFLGYVFVLVFVYPLIVQNDFDFVYTASLIVIMAFSSFGQYYWGITNMLLLYSDQKIYIPLALDSISIILNTVIAVCLIQAGSSVQVVKFVATLIFLSRPLIMHIYVKRHYAINKEIQYEEEPLKQKWNGMAQHLSSAAMDNTAMVILSVLSTLSSVSVYYIYNLIAFGLRQIFCTATVGFQSYFGHIYATENESTVSNRFCSFEFLGHVLITIIFSTASLLIVPFVKIYTTGVTDANYDVPLFALCLVISTSIYCYRTLYYVLIKAMGHYKQTQCSAIVEMTINIGLSIILVISFGLVGVAISLGMAVLYRLSYFVMYLSKQSGILDIKKSISFIVGDTLSISTMLVLSLFHKYGSDSYIIWIGEALITAIIATIITLFYHYIINKTYKEVSLRDITYLLKEK